MKTTREVFIIMRAGKIDKETMKLSKKHNFVNLKTIRNMASRHLTSFYVGNAFKINKKNNSNFAKINETIPVKKITIAWNI